jgi:RNA polymerase sigma-70 factor (ECF subfamily)
VSADHRYETLAAGEIVPLFSRYLEEEIGPEECTRMQKHVDGCPSCRPACDALKQTLSLCRAEGRGGSVPRDVQELVRRALHDLTAAGA